MIKVAVRALVKALYRATRVHELSHVLVDRSSFEASWSTPHWQQGLEKNRAVY